MVAIILNYFTKKTSLVNKDVYTVSQKGDTILLFISLHSSNWVRRRKNCENR